MIESNWTLSTKLLTQTLFKSFYTKKWRQLSSNYIFIWDKRTYKFKSINMKLDIVTIPSISNMLQHCDNTSLDVLTFEWPESAEWWKQNVKIFRNCWYKEDFHIFCFSLLKYFTFFNSKKQRAKTDKLYQIVNLDSSAETSSLWLPFQCQEVENWILISFQGLNWEREMLLSILLIVWTKREDASFCSFLTEVLLSS